MGSLGVYKGEVVVFRGPSVQYPPELVAAAFEEAGWYRARGLDKGQLYDFQDVPTLIRGVDGILGRGHARIYEEGGETIVTVHGDKWLVTGHEHDPRRTAEAVRKFQVGVERKIFELAGIKR
jgi:hypothetical protein